MDIPPLHDKCHWEIRIGQLIPACSDRWWILSDEASYQAVANEVKALVMTRAVPIIADYLTEKGLLELWGKILGGCEYPILKNKAILLAEQNDFDQLPESFRWIREICHGGTAEEGAEKHIAEVQQRFHLKAQ